MPKYNQICDEVTKCDKANLGLCHAVSYCFNSVCDDVTKFSLISSWGCGYAGAHGNTLSTLSHCHNVLINNHLACDKVKSYIVTTVTGTKKAITRCQKLANGRSQAVTRSFTNLVIRLLKLGAMAAVSTFTLLGHQLINQISIGVKIAATSFTPLGLLMIESCGLVCSVVVPSPKRFGGAALTTSEKVLLSSSRYGLMSRGIALVSPLKNGVSFRFNLINQ